MRWSRESAFIATVCIADLVTTMLLVSRFGAEEANPMMAFFLERHLWAFVLVKAAFCLVPLAFLEWARRRNPRFVTQALRIGGALYLGLYCAGVWKANMGPIDAAMAASDRLDIEINAIPLPREYKSTGVLNISRG